jgi:predicted nucleic-acid-binding protein
VIAVDTNVLLRRLLNDNEVQAEKARRLFDAGVPVLITDIVLVETVWTLKGKRYSAQKDDIVSVITSLLEEPNVVFESQQAVWSALNDYLAAAPVKTANGLKTADLADALIVQKAKVIARQWQEKYAGTYTFDQAALELSGTRQP